MNPQEQRAAYTAWLVQVETSGVTPSLGEYARWARFDDNLPWRLAPGHLVNLLDQATDRADVLRAQLDAIAEVVDPGWLAGRILPRMIGAEEMAQLAAIRAVLGAAQEDTGTTRVSENTGDTPSGY